MASLAGKTLLITGASRGIGKAIGLRAARDGANIAVVAKTAEPHPKLDGTVHMAVAELEAAGGRALACICDIRFEEQVQAAVEQTAKAFGGIDIVVNNASAIHRVGTIETPMKRYDLMNEINTRGTFLVSKLCLPHLLRARNPHILNISPPLDMSSEWFQPSVAYTIAKYGMSMCAIGMAEEFKRQGVAVNALWPRTAIATAAVRNLLGGEEAVRHCRKPEIMADAAYVILNSDSRKTTGNLFIDEDVLRGAGVKNFDGYAVEPGQELKLDFYVRA